MSLSTEQVRVELRLESRVRSCAQGGMQSCRASSRAALVEHPPRTRLPTTAHTQSGLPREVVRKSTAGGAVELPLSWPAKVHGHRTSAVPLFSSFSRA
jgi:hypothetical protein